MHSFGSFYYKFGFSDCLNTFFNSSHGLWYNWCLEEVYIAVKRVVFFSSGWDILTVSKNSTLHPNEYFFKWKLSFSIYDKTMNKRFFSTRDSFSIKVVHTKTKMLVISNRLLIISTPVGQQWQLLQKGDT